MIAVVSRHGGRYDRTAHVDRVLNLGLVGFIQRTALEILGRVAWHHGKPQLRQQTTATIPRPLLVQYPHVGEEDCA
jgi:hypothetical protein